MLNIEFAPICLTVVSPAVVEVGELRVVRQVESSAADPTVSHMVTPVPPGHQHHHVLVRLLSERRRSGN